MSCADRTQQIKCTRTEHLTGTVHSVFELDEIKSLDSPLSENHSRLENVPLDNVSKHLSCLEGRAPTTRRTPVLLLTPTNPSPEGSSALDGKIGTTCAITFCLYLIPQTSGFVPWRPQRKQPRAENADTQIGRNCGWCKRPNSDMKFDVLARTDQRTIGSNLSRCKSISCCLLLRLVAPFTCGSSQ